MSQLSVLSVKLCFLGLFDDAKILGQLAKLFQFKSLILKHTILPGGILSYDLSVLLEGSARDHVLIDLVLEVATLSFKVESLLLRLLKEHFKRLVPTLESLALTLK